MKTIFTLVIGMMMISFNAQAQEELSSDVSPYKYEEVRYYYYPNLQAYFDTKVGMYLYVENGEWVEDEALPTTARGYSLKNGQYVMIKDYTGDDPYTLFTEHKKLYPADYSSRPKKPTPKTETIAMQHQQTLASN